MNTSLVFGSTQTPEGPPSSVVSLLPPVWSSSMTTGAALQQVPIGGVCSSYSSSSVSVSGRLVIQVWSFESTNTPVTEPITQWLGNSSGQVGSILNVGTPAAGA